MVFARLTTTIVTASVVSQVMLDEEPAERHMLSNLADYVAGLRVAGFILT